MMAPDRRWAQNDDKWAEWTSNTKGSFLMVQIIKRDRF